MAATLLTDSQHLPASNLSPLPVEVQRAESRWLVASPYLEQPHLLDLDTLDPQDRLFAIALSSLQLATEDYAIVRYEDVFDFEALMTRLKSLADRQGIGWKRQAFYVVEFRSTLKSEHDNERLFYLDRESHKEAVASGGLLKYWYGVPNADRKNLATCFWRTREDATKGGQGPRHREARGIILKTFEHINVKGLRLTIEDDVSGWKIEPWA